AAERLSLFEPPAAEPVERGSGKGAGRAAGAGGGAGSGSAGGRGVGAGNNAWTEVMPVVRGDRFRFGGDAVVEESEQVTNVIAILGSAVIDGVVQHDVLAVGGDVRLGPKAVVRGAVTTIGGVLRADANARISGQVSELSVDNANL